METSLHALSYSCKALSTRGRNLLLLDHGANPNVQMTDGSKLSHGANPSLENSKGLTAADEAERNDMDALAQLLRDAQQA